MNAPKIEKNVPIVKGDNKKYSWIDSVEKGDSFLWPSGALQNLRGAAYVWKLRLITRRIDADNHRVWISEYL